MQPPQREIMLGEVPRPASRSARSRIEWSRRAGEGTRSRIERDQGPVREVWFAVPTICVEDSADLLALYLPPGAEFGFPDEGVFPCGRHPWQTAGHTAWTGHGKLMLQRPGEAHSVDVFWSGP
ncbi:hypothetical protein [Verrucosispora sp. TAA-831]|uniref:hypothetical protein n=1 Tax=Verrucosispora sp. TAA-831 TaxID=3422227 RepID=UPI003D6DBC2B